jgi:hypothetical protein
MSKTVRHLDVANEQILYNKTTQSPLRQASGDRHGG